MGMAYRAPMDSYKGHYTVTDHALQRLRERLTEEAKQLYRTDGDLKNALDLATFDAIQQGDYSHITDEQVPSMIVNLKKSHFTGMWALLKPEKHPSKHKPEKYISTCLTDEQVTANKSNSGWGWGHKTSQNSKLGTLGEKLKPVLEAQMKQAAAQPPKKPEPVVKEPTSILGIDEDKRLVTWPDEKTKTEKSQVMSKKEATSFIQGFIEDGGDSDEIRVFKMAWVMVLKKVRVEVDI